MTGKIYTSLDPSRLSGAVVIWLYLHVATEVVQAMAYFYAMTDPQGGEIAIGLSALVFLAVYLICSVVALKWIYRVTRNAHAFAHGLPTSPAWAIGWFFIPVATLWKPYAALGDVWQASERPLGWRSAPKPRFLGWWWAAWIAANVSGYLASIVARYTSDLQVLGPVMIAAALPAIAAALLFIRVVNRLSSLQLAQITFGAERLAEPSAAGAPLALEGI